MTSANCIAAAAALAGAIAINGKKREKRKLIYDDVWCFSGLISAQISRS